MNWPDAFVVITMLICGTVVVCRFIRFKQFNNRKAR